MNKHTPPPISVLATALACASIYCDLLGVDISSNIVQRLLKSLLLGDIEIILGKAIRVLLPSCAGSCIRAHFQLHARFRRGLYF